MFVARNFLFPLVFVVLVLTTQPQFPFDSEQADRWMDLIGIGIACTGQLCRALAIGQADNIRRGGRQKKVAAKHLITWGIYAHTRNPLYLGNLLVVIGLSVIANNSWWYLSMLPLFAGVYWSIIFAEEEFLARQFGQEYIEYCRSVPRLLPRLAGVWRSCAAVAFDWQRVLRKEYSTACSGMTMTVGLLIWERWARFGYDARATQIHVLVVCLVAVGLFYVGSRQLNLRLKKARA
jgi:protein-S-isoprenylcysteine O-methyltransferase Ste14